jgi:hypothetical protein
MFSESLKTIHEFGIFLLNPNPIVETKKRKSELLVLFIFVFLLIKFVDIFLSLFFEVVPPSTPHISKISIWVILWGFVSIPVLEEIWFRLFLNLKNRWIFGTGIFAFLYFSFNLLEINVQQFQFVNDNNRLFFYLGFLFFSLLIFIPKVFETIKIILIKNYFYFFYFICIAFAFAHFWNGGNLGFQIVSVISPLIGSVFLGFFRNKYNLQTAILFHFLYNLAVGVF